MLKWFFSMSFWFFWKKQYSTFFKLLRWVNDERIFIFRWTFPLSVCSRSSMHNLSGWRTEKFFAAVPKGLIRFLPLRPLWDFTQHIHSTSSSSAENQQLYNDFFKCWWGVAMDVCQRTEFGSKNYTMPCPGPLTDCMKHTVSCFWVPDSLR